ncbi:MAG: iron-sulfur cluster repair di-iron protein [Myxococcales bacterium]|nr:iron-sulfur cluster repair di-iron protein [Myxococcales bacterium]
MSMISTQKTIAEWVLDHSECASVFQRHHIDFCCRGHLTVDEACDQKGLNPKTILEDLNRAIAERQGGPSVDYRTLSTVALIAHIIQTHHEYLRKTLPFLRPLASKVARVHGDTNANLHELELIVFELVETLLPHLDAEEQELFPLLMTKNPDKSLVDSQFTLMAEDHLLVGELLARMRKTTNQFRLPQAACNSYRTLFSELEQLEGDILRHVHLENHVLMPRFVSTSTPLSH